MIEMNAHNYTSMPKIPYTRIVCVCVCCLHSTIVRCAHKACLYIRHNLYHYVIQYFVCCSNAKFKWIGTQCVLYALIIYIIYIYVRGVRIILNMWTDRKAFLVLALRFCSARGPQTRVVRSDGMCLGRFEIRERKGMSTVQSRPFQTDSDSCYCSRHRSNDSCGQNGEDKSGHSSQDTHFLRPTSPCTLLRTPPANGFDQRTVCCLYCRRKLVHFCRIVFAYTHMACYTLNMSQIIPYYTWVLGDFFCVFFWCCWLLLTLQSISSSFFHISTFSI